MNSDPTVTATIAVFLTAQTGALIYYAGVVITMLRNHEKRLDNLEAERREERRLPQLTGKEAIGYERI